MSIEDTLERIATALETIAKNGTGEAAAPAETKPKPETAAAKKKREAAEKKAADDAKKKAEEAAAKETPATPSEEVEEAETPASDDDAPVMDLATLKKMLLAEAKIHFGSDNVAVIKDWLKEKKLQSVDNVKPEERAEFLEETRAYFDKRKAEKEAGDGEDEI